MSGSLILGLCLGLTGPVSDVGVLYKVGGESVIWEDPYKMDSECIMLGFRTELTVIL